MAPTRSLRLVRLVGVDPPPRCCAAATLPVPTAGHCFAPCRRRSMHAWLGIVRAKAGAVRDKVALLRGHRLAAARGFRYAPTPRWQTCAPARPAMAGFIDPLLRGRHSIPHAGQRPGVFAGAARQPVQPGHRWLNLLLPCTDLSALFPGVRDALAGAARRPGGHRPTYPAAGALPSGRWQLGTVGAAHGRKTRRLRPHHLACPSWEAARLVEGLANTAGLAAAARWSATANALRFEAITTVYAPPARLPLPMLALRNTAEHLAQFVFDRGQLDGQQGLLLAL